MIISFAGADGDILDERYAEVIGAVLRYVWRRLRYAYYAVGRVYTAEQHGIVF